MATVQFSITIMKQTAIIDTKEIIKKMLTKNEYRYAEYLGLKLFAGEPCYNGRFKGETKQDKAYAKSECEKRVDAIRKSIVEHLGESTLEQWTKEDNARLRHEAQLVKDRKNIAKQLREAGMFGVYNTIQIYRMGDNVDDWNAVYSDCNAIKVVESRERYSSRCKFIKTTRSFTFCIRKGWNVCKVGNLVTFYKGKFDRTGMACEWIEQGKCISDFRTIKGFLVRGEHIEAKSLKEAKAINANHRAMQLARALNARKRLERRQQQKANGTLLITFADSLASGNCRPGTQQFKLQYEEAIGHEAKSISIADLRKYSKQFGVEYYAEKTIEYALNH